MGAVESAIVNKMCTGTVALRGNWPWSLAFNIKCTQNEVPVLPDSIE